MNIEELREYCLSKPHVTEEFPFDTITLVFKVAGKMFALTSLEGDFYVNLKCDPERAIELREQYLFIKPGWHMNKKHWNTIDLEQDTDANFIKSLVDHSYNCVTKGFSKKARKDLGI